MVRLITGSDEVELGEGTSQVKLQNFNILSMNPLIAYIDNFSSESDSGRFIENLNLKSLQQAAVSPTLQTKDVKVDAQVRDARQVPLLPGVSPFADELRARVTGVLNLSPEHSEPPMTIHYKPGGQYKTHLDAVDHNDQTDLQDVLAPRVYTGLLYLNDNFTGGETEFPRLGIKVKPKAGRLVIWQNIASGSTTPHPLSLHAGLPVESGEKYIITFWMTTRLAVRAFEEKKKHAASVSQE